MRHILLPAFAVLLLLGCSRSPREQSAVAEEEAPKAAGIEEALILEAAVIAETEETAGIGEAAETSQAPRRNPRFALSPASARPGEFITLGYSDDFEGGTPGKEGLQAVLLDHRERRLAKAVFFDLPREEGEGEPGKANIAAAVLAIPSTAAIGDAIIRVGFANGIADNILRDIPFTIESREFRSETIHLNQENTDIRTAPDPQKTAEAEQLWAVILRAGREIYSEGPFTPPVESTRRTSPYGSRRVYQYADGKSDTTIHAGVDIGVPTGTEVRASAAGRVALARERIVTGNTVILEHLPGVYSLYYHMDSIAVGEGSVIEGGTLLGESGSTGLATGPHLHWEIRVSGENADPDAFLSRPLLDKNDIIDKLTNYERAAD